MRKLQFQSENLYKEVNNYMKEASFFSFCGNNEQALKCLEQVIKLKPTYASAHCH